MALRPKLRKALGLWEEAANGPRVAPGDTVPIKTESQVSTARHKEPPPTGLRSKSSSRSTRPVRSFPSMKAQQSQHRPGCPGLGHPATAWLLPRSRVRDDLSVWKEGALGSPTGLFMRFRKGVTETPSMKPQCSPRRPSGEKHPLALAPRMCFPETKDLLYLRGLGNEARGWPSLFLLAATSHATKTGHGRGKRPALCAAFCQPRIWFQLSGLLLFFLVSNL